MNYLMNYLINARLRLSRCASALSSIAMISVLVFAFTLLASACNRAGGDSTSASASAMAPSKITIDAGLVVTADPALKAMLPENIKSSGVLRVATNMPFPPWEMYTAVGSKDAMGFDYDFAQALAAKLDVKMSFDQTPFDAIIPALLAGKEDVVIAAMGDTKEREKTVAFVDYAIDSSGILVAKGNPEKIATLDDLSGKKVAIQKGSEQVAFLNDKNKKLKAAGKPAITVLMFPGENDCFLAVKSGKAQAVVFGYFALGYAAKTVDNGAAFDVVHDPANPDGYNPSLVGVAILKDNAKLINAVQKAAQALIDDGIYAKIGERWGMPAMLKTAEVNKAMH